MTDDEPRERRFKPFYLKPKHEEMDQMTALLKETDWDYRKVQSSTIV